MKKKKFSLYGLFHSKRDDAEDAHEEDTRPTLKRFFKLCWRKFWKLISIDLLMLPMLIPPILAAYLYLVMDQTPTAQNPLFSQLFGANMIQQTPESTFLLDLFGPQFSIPAYHNTGTYIGIGICVVFLLVTFGWQNIGCTYLLRGIVKGDPIFLFSDYFYAIKRNFKQGFFLGVIDFVLLFLIGFDLMYFSGLIGTFWMDVMFWAVTALGILYLFMRFYIYHLQITFHLSIRKILKNALIFTTLGIKRNLMAVLGMVLLAVVFLGLAAVIITAFGAGALGFLLMIIPLFIPVQFAFMSSYAAYPIIDRYMIEPFVGQEEASDEIDEETDEEDEETESTDSSKSQ